jgi:polysaccharide export outer membrane protein
MHRRLPHCHFLIDRNAGILINITITDMKIRFIFLSLVLLCSCVSHKSLVYLQDIGDVGDVVGINLTEYVIKTGDILHLRVQSLDKDVESIFNTISPGATAGAGTRSNLYLQGYTVNSSGVVNVPIVGEVLFAGKTIEEARKTLQQGIDEYFVGATVMIKVLNSNFSILGEVSRPGVYDMFSDKFSIMDALAMAGDLGEFGNRQVSIWRRGETELEHKTIDLTSRDVISSEWFFLQPGDLVYVEPVKQKRTGFATFPFGILFQSITTGVTLFYFFKALTN